MDLAGMVDLEVPKPTMDLADLVTPLQGDPVLADQSHHPVGPVADLAQVVPVGDLVQVDQAHHRLDPARVLAPEAANSLLPDRPAGLRVPVWPGRAGWLAPVPAAVPR